jgi:hypothetical protein
MAWDWKRAGLAVATGGASEGYRAVVGEDPLKTGERLLEGVGIKSPTDNINEDKMLAPTSARAQTIYEQSLADAERARTWAGAPTIGQVGPIERASDLTAERVTAPTRGEAYEAGPVERYDAALAGAPRDVTAQTITADMMASPMQTQNVALDRVGDISAEANALRGEQIAAARAIGEAPSAAAAQMDASLAKIAREQLGMAAQARGAERAGSRREAMLAIGQQGLEAASMTAAEAAREEQQKRAGMSSALSGIRSTDVDVASTSARLAQEANNLDAQIRAETARGNTAAANALRQRQAELNLQARTAGAQLTATTESGNAQRALDAALADAEARNAAARFGAGAANLSAEELAARRTATEQANLARGVTVDTTNVQTRLAAEQFNKEAFNTAAQREAELKLQRDTAAGEQSISSQQTKQSGAASGIAGATGGAELDLAAQQAKIDAKKKQADAEAAANERLVKTGTTILQKAGGA